MQPVAIELNSRRKTLELSRMKSPNQILISAFVAVALFVGFTQLPLRAQGRIVEFCTLGEWPLEWAVRRQFERKQPELHSIIEFMNEVPEIAGLTVTPVGLRANLREEKGVGRDLKEPDILQALMSVEAHFVKGHEDRISIILGTEYRGKTSFHASYVHPLEQLDLPSCESVNANDRPKIGNCGVELSANWYAVYQWEPADIDELEQALQELR